MVFTVSLPNTYSDIISLTFECSYSTFWGDKIYVHNVRESPCFLTRRKIQADMQQPYPIIDNLDLPFSATTLRIKDPTLYWFVAERLGLQVSSLLKTVPTESGWNWTEQFLKAGMDNCHWETHCQWQQEGMPIWLHKLAPTCFSAAI